MVVVVVVVGYQETAILSPSYLVSKASFYAN